MLNNRNSELIQGLMDLGMSEREAKVFLALLSKSYVTAPTLQKISGVPQSKIYAVIDNLVRHGFCTERKEGRVRTFEAIDPQIILEAPLQNLELRVKNSRKLKEKLHDIFKTASEAKEPFEFVEILHGKESIHHHYCQLIRNAQREILGFARPPFAASTREKLEEQVKESLAFHERNGVARWVYELNIPEHDWIIPGLLEGQKMGGSFRVAEKLPLKMSIFDEKILLITAEESTTQSDDLVMSHIKQSTMVKGYITLFDFFWNQSIDFEEWIKLHD